jgi:hypothetical protein
MERRLHSSGDAMMSSRSSTESPGLSGRFRGVSHRFASTAASGMIWRFVVLTHETTNRGAVRWAM